MDLHDIADLVTAFAAVAGAGTSTFAALFSIRNGRRIEQVRRATSNMKDELVAAVGGRRFAEGLIEGKTGNKQGG